MKKNSFNYNKFLSFCWLHLEICRLRVETEEPKTDLISRRSGVFLENCRMVNAAVHLFVPAQLVLVRSEKISKTYFELNTKIRFELYDSETVLLWTNPEYKNRKFLIQKMLTMISTFDTYVLIIWLYQYLCPLWPIS